MFSASIFAETGNDVKSLLTDIYTTRGYNKNIRPVVDQVTKLTVKASFYLNSVIDFDEKTENLKTAGYLYLTWVDEYFKWDPAGFNNTPFLFIPQEEIWKPDITLKNSFKSFSGLGAKFLNVVVGSDGTVTWQPYQVLESTCAVEITYFPFDVQECELKFSAWSYSKDQVDVNKNTIGVGLDEYIPSALWEIDDTSTEEVNTAEAAVIFKLKLRRRPRFYVINILIPIMFLSVLNVFSFLLPVTSAVIDFDEKTESLKTAGYLYITWVDEYFWWDPVEFNNTPFLFIPQDEMWKPDITLKNSFKSFSGLGAKYLNVVVSSDGTVAWHPYQVLESTCAVAITYFPFDIQECELKFSAWSYSKYEVAVNKNTIGVGLDEYIPSALWEIEDTSTEEVNTAEAAVIFKLKLRRRPRFYVVNILIPVIFLSILNVFSFLLPVTSAVIDFDEKTESLKTAGYLNIVWVDEYFWWDPVEFNNTPFLFIPQDEIWKPDITLKNSFKSFSGLGAKYLNVVVSSDGTVAWHPYQVLESTCAVAITYFPFDIQECELKFSAWSYSKYEVAVNKNTIGVGLDEYIPSALWEIEDTSTEEVNTAEAAVIFKLKLRRRPRFYVVNILIPVIFLSILNVFSFLLPVTSAVIDFDEKTESLKTAGNLHVVWVDEYFWWDPVGFNNTLFLFIPQDEIWKPDITLKNSFKSFSGLGAKYLNVVVSSDGTVEWFPYQVLESTCAVAITYFPFDIQECELKFSAWSYSKYEISIHKRTIGVGLDEYSPSALWEIEDTSTEEVNTTEAALIFKLKLRRRPRFYVANILIPVFFLSILNVFSFLLPVTSGERAGYAITVFLSLTVFLTIVSDQLPNNSQNTSLLAVYIMLVTGLSTAIVILCLYQLRLQSWHDTDKPVGNSYRRVVKICNILRCKTRDKTSSKAKVAPKENSSSNSDFTDNVSDKPSPKITWLDVVNGLDYIFFIVSVLYTVICTLTLIAILGMHLYVAT
ncbi:Neuronal acetylcholine receptor subunit alpha-7 [Mactra antiquata]